MIILIQFQLQVFIQLLAIPSLKLSQLHLISPGAEQSLHEIAVTDEHNFLISNTFEEFVQPSFPQCWVAV